jgi:hypothetical protein
LGSESTEGANEIRPDRLYLALQKRKTGFDLIGPGIAIIRRTALDDIADINLITGKIDGFDYTAKEIAGGADKGFALPVLIESGAFTDKNELGPGISVTKYNPVTLFCQSTALAFT